MSANASYSLRRRWNWGSASSIWSRTIGRDPREARSLPSPKTPPVIPLVLQPTNPRATELEMSVKGSDPSCTAGSWQPSRCAGAPRVARVLPARGAGLRQRRRSGGVRTTHTRTRRPARRETGVPDPGSPASRRRDEGPVSFGYWVRDLSRPLDGAYVQGALSADGEDARAVSGRTRSRLLVDAVHEGGHEST